MARTKNSKPAKSATTRSGAASRTAKTEGARSETSRDSGRPYQAPDKVGRHAGIRQQE